MNALRFWASALIVAALAGAAGGGVAAKQRVSRPFDHRRHESVSCRSCHGVGAAHRSNYVRTARDCAACHHDRARTQTCRDCHAADQLGVIDSAVTPLSLSVWKTPRWRRLPFAHATHGQVECLQCHATPVTLQRSRECNSCHTQHHGVEAACASCHDRPPVQAHPAEAHLGCAGAQCHAARVAPAPTLSRELCLVCHREQRAHEPALPCARCHQIPEPETPVSGRVGS